MTCNFIWLATTTASASESLGKYWVGGVGKDGGGEISAIKVVVVSKKGEGALLKPAGSGHKTSCCFSLFLRIKLCIVAPPRCQEFDRHFIQGAFFSRYLPCVSVSVGMRWCFFKWALPGKWEGRVRVSLWKIFTIPSFWLGKSILHIYHFFSTGRIFGSQIFHPKIPPK